MEEKKIAGTMLDRRRKITPEQREEIRQRFDDGEATKAQLAREYKVSAQYIAILVNKERAQHVRNTLTKYRKEGRFKYSKEAWNAIMRKHRAYKKECLTKQND